MMSIGKLKKLGRFVGSPQLKGLPIFLNSMPKAGTNLMENFLVCLGYKRNLSRCLNESNIGKASLKPRDGHFYIGHLVDDESVHSAEFLSIYLRRDLWSCLKSYVNYMYIDQKHPVSHFLRKEPTLEAVRLLFLTNDNPNNRPLVDEYLRFYQLDLNRYQMRIEFNDLVTCCPQLTKKVAQVFSLDEDFVKECLMRG